LSGCGAGSSSSGGGGDGAGGGGQTTTPRAQPTDITPISGEVYYVLNQLSGLQGDLIGFCLDSASSARVTWVVQNPCAATATQRWTLTPVSNGYYTIANASTGLLVDLFQGSTAAGAWLDQSALSGTATQSQQWLLSPAFFRGVDNALLEKQQAAQSKNGVPWWSDAGSVQDVLHNDGYFQITSANPGAGGTTNVLDDSGGSSATGNPVVQSLANSSQEQEWDVVSGGGMAISIL
jgi:hypothetical protein